MCSFNLKKQIFSIFSTFSTLFQVSLPHHEYRADRLVSSMQTVVKRIVVVDSRARETSHSSNEPRPFGILLKASPRSPKNGRLYLAVLWHLKDKLSQIPSEYLIKPQHRGAPWAFREHMKHPDKPSCLLYVPTQAWHTRMFQQAEHVR